MREAKLTVKERKLIEAQLKACKKKEPRRYPEDIVGFRFGKLIALKEVIHPNLNYKFYECVCDCGQLILVNRDRLTNGSVTICQTHPRKEKVK
jgi:hypothetical protein